MTRPVKVGIFFVVGLALFCAGLFLIGSSAHIFGSHFVVYARFNNIQGLTRGSSVHVGGMDAGQVVGIQIPDAPAGQFLLKLHVDQRFHPIIRKDSTASIQTQGFVGNEFINIKKGTANSPRCPNGCTLPSQEAVSMGELMQEGQKLAKSIQGTIHHADTAIGNFSKVGKNANDIVVAMKPKINQMADNANAIVAGVRNGKGAAGKVLTDKKAAENVAATVANARQASANLNQTSRQINSMVSGVHQNDLPKLDKTLDNAQQASGRINQAMGSFLGPKNQNENTGAAVRQTIDQAQEAMGNLSSDTEALKTNFFLRGFFNRRGFFNLATITPGEYAHSRFVKKPRKRVWIPASELFKDGSNDAPELGKEGSADLDKCMSALTPYLPNNPIVVEGYATGGRSDQQYLKSRQRALAVRHYLIEHFHLQPKRVGIMPLGDHPPAETGKESWNGVCLVLVVSKPHHGLF
ncbi:MAG TPA: MlaD family protein [Terriglobia bacterium]|nr:MlaD family protein [Terriglobia bacterium]